MKTNKLQNFHVPKKHNGTKLFNIKNIQDYNNVESIIN